MNKQTPFRQHAPEAPKNSNLGQKWYRRHIIFDHVSKLLMIQVMWDGDGYQSLKEKTEIDGGAWWNYVPAKMVNEVRTALASGYTIRTVAVMGDLVGEDHMVMQLVDMRFDGAMSSEKELLTPIHDRTKQG